MKQDLSEAGKIDIDSIDREAERFEYCFFILDLNVQSDCKKQQFYQKDRLFLFIYSVQIYIN